jgi:hypothetical protein
MKFYDLKQHMSREKLCAILIHEIRAEVIQ